MVGGDFNEIMQDIDRRSLRTGNVCKHTVNSLKSFIKANKLVDVWRICIGESPSNSPFLKDNGAEVPKWPTPIVFKEWRDTRTFSNLKSTHCTLLILLIINLVAKKSLCIVSKVQSIKLFAPCGTLKVQREQ